MMGASAYENRICDGVARVPRRARSLHAVRQRNEVSAFRSTLHDCPARARIQKEVAQESEPARTEAEGQALIPFAPSVAAYPLGIARDCWADRAPFEVFNEALTFQVLTHLSPALRAFPAISICFARFHTSPCLAGLGPRFPRHGLVDGFRFSH